MKSWKNTAKVAYFWPIEVYFLIIPKKTLKTNIAFSWVIFNVSILGTNLWPAIHIFVKVDYCFFVITTITFLVSVVQIGWEVCKVPPKEFWFDQTSRSLLCNVKLIKIVYCKVNIFRWVHFYDFLHHTAQNWPFYCELANRTLVRKLFKLIQGKLMRKETSIWKFQDFTNS